MSFVSARPCLECLKQLNIQYFFKKSGFYWLILLLLLVIHLRRMDLEIIHPQITQISADFFPKGTTSAEICVICGPFLI